MRRRGIHPAAAAVRRAPHIRTRAKGRFTLGADGGQEQEQEQEQGINGFNNAGAASARVFLRVTDYIPPGAAKTVFEK